MTRTGGGTADPTAASRHRGEGARLGSGHGRVDTADARDRLADAAR
jgi:hypothetical protein